MKILSLDPSSKCVGYAIGDGDRLIECGKLKPIKGDAIARIRSIRDDIKQILKLEKPDCLVIEKPSPQAPSGRNNSGQATYGMAVGLVIDQCFEYQDQTNAKIITVSPDVWTNRVKKERRQAAIAYKYQQYNPSQDKGGDVSDAIGLLEWWGNQRKIGVTI